MGGWRGAKEYKSPYLPQHAGFSQPSSLTSLLTSDDTREAHSFLESDQYYPNTAAPGGGQSTVGGALLAWEAKREQKMLECHSGYPESLDRVQAPVPAASLYAITRRRPQNNKLMPQSSKVIVMASTAITLRREGGVTRRRLRRPQPPVIKRLNRNNF